MEHVIQQMHVRLHLILQAVRRKIGRDLIEHGGFRDDLLRIAVHIDNLLDIADKKKEEVRP